MAIIAVFTALTAPYLKSWRLKYDPTEIVEGYSLFGLNRSTSYALSALSSITSYHADPTMLGIPFDTLIFDFGTNKLALRTSDWTRESLKQFIRDLTSYRNEVPVDQSVLNFVAGEYDSIFYDASDRNRSAGYADRASF